MPRRHHPRVVIIGLDGADWSVLQPLLEDGAMPTLRRFVAESVRGTLESVLPVNSMAAWTSLVTGVNPGRHGVFNFERKSEPRIPFETLTTSSRQIRFPSVFQVLGEHGVRCGVIDLPPFYPPVALNGYTVGGIAADRFPLFAHPPELQRVIVERVGDFVSDPPWLFFDGRRPELIRRAIAMAENRFQVGQVLRQVEPVDILCLVFTAPDRVFHPFCRDIMEHGPDYPLAREFFAALDGILARLLGSVDLTRTDVLFVSDHGFQPVDRLFDVNQYLAEAGLCRWRWETPAATHALRGARALLPAAARIDAALRRRPLRPRRRLLPASTAYSDIADAVDVNLLGRECSGTVAPEDYKEAREEVIDRLLAFRDPDTGAPVVNRVVRREEYFHGPFADEAPDLVLTFHPGYTYNGNLGVLLSALPILRGAHSLTGIIAGRGPHFRAPAEVRPLSLMDVAPTLYALLEVPPPAPLDGRVAQELLVEPLAAPTAEALPANEGAPTQRGTDQAAGGYTPEEEERVRERLRGLGYID